MYKTLCILWPSTITAERAGSTSPLYHQVKEASDGDPLIHVFTNLTGVGNVEVNAFQRLSEVVVQKSIREGFGLVVSEALWKETPVVAGRAGGIPLQVADGVGGVLVDGVEECAQGILTLLRDDELARSLAEKGKERVREHFLLPRILLNELSLVRDVLGGVDRRRAPLGADHDPVCGMALGIRKSRSSSPTEEGRSDSALWLQGEVPG